MKELVGASAIILGYGREGQSVHRYIRSHHPEMEIGIADEKGEVTPAVEGKVNLHLGKEYLESLLSYDIIIRSPGIPLSTPAMQEAIESGKHISSGTNIFFSECPGVVIGITGTKGKSTTSTLISDILKTTYTDVRLVGNIGEPALDHLSDSNNKTLFVDELSSHQLEDTHYSPHVAVVLRIVPEHLSYHGSFEAYVKAKEKITKYQTAEDMVVFDPANSITEEIAEASLGRKLRFSSDNMDVDCYIKEGQIYVAGKLVMPVAEISLLGQGNQENVLAAIAVGNIMGVDLAKIRKAVREFKSLPHRLEYAGEKNGITFYDDSLATIPEATINALEALGPNVQTLIAGGFDRGLDFTVLAKYLQGSLVENLILFPTTGEKIWRAILALGENPRLQKFDVSSMKEAVQIALANTKPGNICLLSPAASSFNLFRDYADRGNQFKKLVNS